MKLRNGIALTARRKKIMTGDAYQTGMVIPKSSMEPQIAASAVVVSAERKPRWVMSEISTMRITGVSEIKTPTWAFQMAETYDDAKHAATGGEGK